MNTNYTELIDSFETCNIDVNIFGHVDHVGVAYEMLRRYDFLKATVRYADSINTIANKVGAAHKFNMTITLAFLSLIAERMEVTLHDTFDEFISQNQDLLSRNFLEQWYLPERLQCDLARTVFLMPNVIPSSPVKNSSVNKVYSTDMPEKKLE